MIKTEHHYFTTFSCSDDKKFQYVDKKGFITEPPQEVLDYEANFNNAPDRTYNHGFHVYDKAYYCENWKLYKVTITKVTQAIHSMWVDDETDKWHFDEPVKLDIIYFIHPITKEEIKLKGKNITTHLKKTVEEFIAN
jgi:hypothetical protein